MLDSFPQQSGRRHCFLLTMDGDRNGVGVGSANNVGGGAVEVSTPFLGDGLQHEVLLRKQYELLGIVFDGGILEMIIRNFVEICV